MADIPLQTIRLAEALLFRSDGPVSSTTLSRALAGESDVAAVIQAVRERTAGLGFELVAAGDGWMFRTAGDLGDELLAATHKRPHRLSRAVLEALLVIAARQPVTRPEIESFRDAPVPQATLSTLQDSGLIRSVGRKPVPGQPRLWATTERFLVMYGVSSLADLDPLLEGLRGPV